MSKSDRAALLAQENGIGMPYYPGCWYWFEGAWTDAMAHDGSATMPGILRPEEFVLIAYNPVGFHTAETWGCALGRAKAASERDWQGVTAFRRLRAQAEGLPHE